MKFTMNVIKKIMRTITLFIIIPLYLSFILGCEVQTNESPQSEHPNPVYEYSPVYGYYSYSGTTGTMYYIVLGVATHEVPRNYSYHQESYPNYHGGGSFQSGHKH
jgi:hypothetical protein